MTVEAVARKARASKPTIYRWWGTRTQLISDAYFRSTPVTVELPDLGNLQADLQSMMESLWRIWSDPKFGDVSRGLLGESLCDPVLLEAYRNDYLPKREASLVQVLERAVERGELAKDTDIDLLVDMLNGFNFMHLIKGKPMSPETIRKHLDSIFSGLRNTPSK